MVKSSRAWLREHLSDPYVKRAQAAGFRSRAAYKLQEIASRDRLFRQGMTVVDLGAAPGGWAQVAARAVGPAGRVIALDLAPVPALPGVTVIQADFREPAGRQALEHALRGGCADVILCDMAPALSGIASVDQARSMALAELALEFAREHLKPGGDFLVKLFHGESFAHFVNRLRRSFDRVQTRKPEASRSRSSEVYLLARGLRRAPADGG
jgi:23S rRNA (uridine2552-2'-O)-methyltransferase